MSKRVLSHAPVFFGRFLTNIPRRFQKTAVITTGLSNYQTSWPIKTKKQMEQQHQIC